MKNPLHTLINFVLISLIAVSFWGCSRESEDDNSELGYVRIELAGKTYSEEKLANIAGTGFADLYTGCNNKRTFTQHIVDLESASFDIGLEIVHFENASDYGNPAAANYPVSSFQTSCYNNLTLSLFLYDKTSSQNGVLQSGKAHTITALTLIPRASDSMSNCYAVMGTFTGQFRFPDGSLKAFSGSYKTFIRVLK